MWGGGLGVRWGGAEAWGGDPGWGMEFMEAGKAHCPWEANVLVLPGCVVGVESHGGRLCRAGTRLPHSSLRMPSRFTHHLSEFQGFQTISISSSKRTLTPGGGPVVS